MTNEELLLYFPHSSDDDLEELFDQRLFEYKQFFATRAVIPKVFKARLEKLAKMDLAYRQLMELEEVATVSCSEVTFPDNVLDAYNLFEREKGIRKIRLLKAASGSELSTAVHCLIALYERFYQKWPILKEESTVIIGKEPDSMELFAVLKEESEKGICSFLELEKTQSQFLRNEMKRVSLWLQKN